MNWEHKSIDIHLSDVSVDVKPAMREIEAAGYEGWELVTVVKDLVGVGITTVFFKRPFDSGYNTNQNIRTVPSEEDLVDSKRIELDRKMQPVPTVETYLAYALDSYYSRNSISDYSHLSLREYINRLMMQGIPSYYDADSDIALVINGTLTMEDHRGSSGIFICSPECLGKIQCFMARVECVGSFRKYLIPNSKSEIHTDALFPVRKALYVSGDSISTFCSTFRVTKL